MKQDIKRRFNINAAEGNSVFLLGPRKVGKSTYLKNNFGESIYIDLLDPKQFLKYLNNPEVLEEELLKVKLTNPEKIQKHYVIIDEVQKLPILLDLVHRLIENENMKFILCGSSAGKLVRGGANMLGGRALKFTMHPLVYTEFADFNLLKILNQGKIPSHYYSGISQELIKSYIGLYLREEILEEGLVRNLRLFSNFLDLIPFFNGELINYSSIARDCGVDTKTVRDYFQILVDTLIGDYVYPYVDRMSRNDLSKSSKFYFFDTGIVQNIKGIRIEREGGEEFGKAFEHFMFTEINAYNSYSRKDKKITFWRTQKGLEVDFVVGKAELAIEVKGSKRVDNKILGGVRKFKEEYPGAKIIIVSANETSRMTSDGFLILNYIEFLEKLWSGQIF